MSLAASPDTVDAVRRFNRFYTEKIGVLSERLYDSAFSLAEARIIYELAHLPQASAAELSQKLSLDPGFVSRILRRLSERKLVSRTVSEHDGRRIDLGLTADGRQAFANLDRRSAEDIGRLIAPLKSDDRAALLKALRVIEEKLGGTAVASPAFAVRPHQPGDMGWIVHRHGVLYAEEYHWDERFEALVAGITAQFIRNFDGRRERCWIAERGGDIVGSVFLVSDTDETAKLRLLYVEPSARGFGIGRHLVDQGTRFARQAGYARITLWTQSILSSARRIYQAAGYRLVKSESHRNFGHDLIGETWELDL